MQIAAISSTFGPDRPECGATQRARPGPTGQGYTAGLARPDTARDLPSQAYSRPRPGQEYEGLKLLNLHLKVIVTIKAYIFDKKYFFQYL